MSPAPMVMMPSPPARKLLLKLDNATTVPFEEQSE